MFICIPCSEAVILLFTLLYLKNYLVLQALIVLFSLCLQLKLKVTLLFHSLYICCLLLHQRSESRKTWFLVFYGYTIRTGALVMVIHDNEELKTPLSSLLMSDGVSAFEKKKLSRCLWEQKEFDNSWKWETRMNTFDWTQRLLRIFLLGKDI